MDLAWIELRRWAGLTSLDASGSAPWQERHARWCALLVASRRRDDFYEVRAQPCRGLRLSVERRREGGRYTNLLWTLFMALVHLTPLRFKDLARSAARQRRHRRRNGAADRVAGPLTWRRGVGHRGSACGVRARGGHVLFCDQRDGDLALGILARFVRVPGARGVALRNAARYYIFSPLVPSVWFAPTR